MRASQYQRYWAKQMFSGEGLPPTSVYNERAMLTMLINTPDTIGYTSVDAIAGNDRIKILLTIGK